LIRSVGEAKDRIVIDQNYRCSETWNGLQSKQRQDNLITATAASQHIPRKRTH
jgi:hypothetical protein